MIDETSDADSLSRDTSSRSSPAFSVYASDFAAPLISSEKMAARALANVSVFIARHLEKSRLVDARPQTDCRSIPPCTSRNRSWLEDFRQKEGNVPSRCAEENDAGLSAIELHKRIRVVHGVRRAHHNRDCRYRSGVDGRTRSRTVSL